MEISNQEYFFYEWLILGKGMTEEQFKRLTPVELNALQVEYSVLKRI